jgi:hypothetical protein
MLFQLHSALLNGVAKEQSIKVTLFGLRSSRGKLCTSIPSAMWHYVVQWKKKFGGILIAFLDFKLSACSECCVLSSG